MNDRQNMTVIKKLPMSDAGCLIWVLAIVLAWQLGLRALEIWEKSIRQQPPQTQPASKP